MLVDSVNKYNFTNFKDNKKHENNGTKLLSTLGQ